ncbi:uncharacterized protein LACBIDRAFT_299623 [Laccaria bicolor S238N-H82]|uniref:Predicted protein n=1 Tax=Laccaria bicolor (strain S238N-H82 / ATCC MYA-4686) TaxID=486041 RepID=B0DF03_LACBS|nr:uncharacterized protein LACBIDRAFT_299623 [Laccaria bicolor S238N-H82]EDR06764.1 predicted protein [Laccaria bicolor S238N-H82]|eukprot:XP_001882611.1 predicted protein [Laccaria bicolor S238N-H82]
MPSTAHWRLKDSTPHITMPPLPKGRGMPPISGHLMTRNNPRQDRPQSTASKDI